MTTSQFLALLYQHILYPPTLSQNYLRRPTLKPKTTENEPDLPKTVQSLPLSSNSEHSNWTLIPAHNCVKSCVTYFILVLSHYRIIWPISALQDKRSLHWVHQCWCRLAVFHRPHPTAGPAQPGFCIASLLGILTRCFPHVFCPYNIGENSILEYGVWGK